MEQTGHRNAKLIFGDLEATIAAKDVPNEIEILGFIPADRSTEFSSMHPIYIDEGEFLHALAISMVKDSLDALAFGDRDFIIRTEVVDSSKNDADKEYILFLCVPSKPLFGQASPQFNFPNYSLMFTNS